MTVTTRKIAIVGVAVLAVVIGLYLRSRTTASPEHQVRAVIQQMVDSANDHEVGGVLEHIATSYRGTGDNELDRQQVRELLLARVVQGGGGAVSWVEESIQVADSRSASALLAVELAGRGASGSPSLDLQLGFEKIDGAWQVVSSHHTRIERQAPPPD